MAENVFKKCFSHCFGVWCNGKECQNQNGTEKWADLDKKCFQMFKSVAGPNKTNKSITNTTAMVTRKPLGIIAVMSISSLPEKHTEEVEALLRVTPMQLP